MNNNPRSQRASTDTKLIASVPFWLTLWAAGAAAASLLGVFSYERRYLFPGVLLTSVAALIVSYRRLPLFRTWVDGLDLRAILAFHVLRAPIGVAFLVLEARGELTAAFAELAGFGDIAVGLGAIGLLFVFRPSDTVKLPRALLLWNALGLFDIALVVMQAQRLLFFVNPRGMLVLGGFPGSMLPSFIVPLVITTHLLVFVRWRRTLA